MAYLKQLTYRVSKLWGQHPGSVEKHEIDTPIHFPEEKDFHFMSNFKADLTLIRLKEEISVLLNNAEIDAQLNCQLCLEPFVLKISIPSTEREFVYEAPKKYDQDEQDLFLIDTKAMTVDISDMVRQEIILHFPLIPVCSSGCKGLCAICGKNKNKTSCTCKVTAKTETYQPFKDLKNLVGSAKKAPKNKKKSKEK